MKPKSTPESRSMSISGGTVNARDIIVGNKTTYGSETSEIHLQRIFQPLKDMALTAAPEKRDEALRAVESIQAEAHKGESANDGVLAKMIDHLVELVPEAARTIASAFSAPILSAVAGPVTQFVLGKIQGR
jgi:hypothetical protein